LESPAVGFPKTSDYKGGLAVQVNAIIKQNNTLLYLATKQSQKLVELEEKFDKLKQEIHTIIAKEVQPADLEDSISSLAKRHDSFSISGKLPVTEHLMARSGTDLKMAKLVMSSPNHLTSDVKDAFSSNFLDYILASPDYVMHAYYANNPYSTTKLFASILMLIPMFNPQEFFLPEELLSPKKQGHDQSFSSTSALPQEFEMRESSSELQKAHAQIAKLQRKQMGNNNKTALARFRIANLEQIIEEIQVRHQANKEIQRQVVYEIMQWQSRYTLLPPKRMSTSEAPAMTQTAIKKLVADSVTTALEAQAANMQVLIIPPDQEKLLWKDNVATKSS
ncbi:hypothetical protein Tco_1217682, partial [Tanacetum coccineum]